ncbi:MAG: hypothetical protein ACYC5Y_15935 [Symbiobacteriia bacterium]
MPSGSVAGSLFNGAEVDGMLYGNCGRAREVAETVEGHSIKA